MIIRQIILKVLHAVIFLSSIFFIHGQQDIVKTILIPPFENKGDSTLEYISDIIPTSFQAILEDIPEYQAVGLAELKAYMKKQGYAIADLKNENILPEIAARFNADLMISGQYYEENNLFVISLEVFSVEQKKIIYRKHKSGKGSIYILDTLDNMVIEMIEDSLGIRLDHGFLSIDTDHGCDIYIDGKKCGQTPIRLSLFTGIYDVRIEYEKKIVKQEIIEVSRDQEIKWDIKLSVNLKVESDKECTVYINDKNMGNTPLNIELIAGNEYKLRVENKNPQGQNAIIDQTTIKTEQNKDMELYFPVGSSIRLITGNNTLRCCIPGLSCEDLPFIFSGLAFGKYMLEVFIVDSQSEQRYIFHTQEVYLNPAQNEIIDLSHIDFTFNWAYCFIPALAQFHNLEPVKGTITLSSFLIGAGILVLCPILTQWYYNEEYLPMVDDFQDRGSDSKYTEKQITEAYNNVKTIFYSTLIGGIVITVFTYIYSAADGYLTMDHIYKLFHQ